MTDRKRDLKLLKVLTLLTYAVLAANAIIILWGSFRGFDLTDEGFYWLNYTHPGGYPVWSGFIVLGAKLVSWFHLDVVSLRWVRFLLLLATHAFFAGAAVRWLGRRVFPGGELWAGRFGFALLLGSVTMPYVWAPSSLSYNDWAAIFGLLAAAFFLLMCSCEAKADSHFPMGVIGPAIGVGFMLGWLVFVKWSSAAGVGALLLAATFCIWGREWRLTAWCLFAIVLGLGLGLGCVQATCIDLRSYFDDAHKYAAMLSGHSHRPAAVLAGFVHDAWHTHLRLLRDFGWAGLLLAIWPAVFYQARRRKWDRLKCWWVGGMLWGVTALAAIGEFFRGADRTAQSLPGHLAVAGLAGVAWLGCWRHVRRLQRPEGPAFQVGPGGLLAGVVLLAGLPWAVAFGTGNSPLFPGAAAGAAWKALFLAGFAAAWPYRALRKWCLGLGVLSLALSQGQFIDGYVLRPYRLAAPLTRQSHTVPNLPRGTGLCFDSETAAFLGNLAERCRAAGMETDRAIIALYDMPGLVYLLGGVSPVTPWYFDPKDVPNLAANALAGIGGQPDSAGSRKKPLLLLNRELDAEIVKALNDAGVDYPAGYTNLGSFQEPWNKKEIRLLAPK